MSATADAPPEASDPATVLTVCSGNICRSVGMERFLAAAWSGDAIVRSAGTIAVVGWDTPGEMRRVIREARLDDSHHDARQLDLDELEATDLVIVATEEHRNWIQRHNGAVPPNTFLATEAAALAAIARRPAGRIRADRIRTAAALLDAARDPEAPRTYPDIDDPYLRGDAAYERAMAEIVETLGTLVEWVG